MISLLNSPKYQGFNKQNKPKQQVNFGSTELNMVKPINFAVVKEGFLFLGGYITTVEELNYLIWEKGVRSILNFADPKSLLLRDEFKFINQHNQRYPDHQIIHNSLPFSPYGDLRLEQVKPNLIEKINSLPKSIYMHCMAGLNASNRAEAIIREASKEGKLNFKI